MGPERFFKPRFAIEGDRLELTGVPVPDKSRLAPAGPTEPLRKWLRPFATYAVVQAASRRIGAAAARAPIDANPADAPAESDGVTAALLRALAREVRAAGADLTVALVPATDARVAQRLGDICRTERIPFIDLAPAFSSARDVLLPFDRHWNARGHAVAARAVADALGGRAGAERAPGR